MTAREWIKERGNTVKWAGGVAGGVTAIFVMWITLGLPQVIFDSSLDAHAEEMGEAAVDTIHATEDALTKRERASIKVHMLYLREKWQQHETDIAINTGLAIRMEANGQDASGVHSSIAALKSDQENVSKLFAILEGQMLTGIEIDVPVDWSEYD
jgi:hypothetical protein